MKNLKKYFLTGLFAVLPIGITIWLIVILLQYLASEAVRAFIGNFLDNYISNTAIVALLEYSIPLFFVVILIPLTGLFVSNVIGKRFDDINDLGVDNKKLIDINEILRYHPIESVGYELRDSMTSMKKII